MTVAEFAESLHFETGTVSAAGGVASIDLPEGWAYLQATDARRVVEDLWGNPADSDILGFLDPPSEDGRLGADFGVIVMYDREGHIKDGDASKMDFDALLREMQSDTRAANSERVKLGYETVQLVAWAEPPHYDAVNKKLYWAKEIEFGGNRNHTLNYDVRVLGRRGYLTLQAVSGIQALGTVDAGMKAILGQVSFTEGNRYQDFNPSIDKVAAYGIGGLIAGKVLAKVGLFAVFAKFGKLIVVGVIGLFIAVRRFFFGGGAKVATEPAEPEAE